LGLSRSTEKVLEIALELLKDETKGEHAPDCLIRQVLCDPCPSDAVDSGLIGRNGLDHRIQGQKRSPGWKRQACVPENVGCSPLDPRPGLCQVLVNRFGERLRQDASERTDICVQPHQGARQRLRIGLLGQGRAPLPSRFVGERFELAKLIRISVGSALTSISGCSQMVASTSS
jgi:hypothetical protein